MLETRLLNVAQSLTPTLTELRLSPSDNSIRLESYHLNYIYICSCMYDASMESE